MAQNLGTVYAALELDTTKFDKGIKQATQSSQKLNSSLGSSMNNAYRASEKLRSSIFNVKNLLLGIATSVAIKKGFDWTVGANANMEQYRNTLATVLKSEQKAIEMLQWAEQFSDKTPFEIPQLVEATVKLESYGLKARDVMTQIGDMAAVMGKDLIQAVEAVADAQTGELERLKEFGITKNMIIEQATKIGLQGIVNAKGQIEDLAGFNIALITLMEEKFAGGMERQSKTYKGMLSNLSDYFSRFGRSVGNETFEYLKGKFSDLLEKLSELEKNGTLDRWSEKLGKALAVIVDWVIKLSEGVGWAIENFDKWEPVLWGTVAALTAFKVISTIHTLMLKLQAITQGMTIAQWALNAAMTANPIGIVAVAIGGLIAAGIALYKNWDTVVHHLKTAWENMKYWGQSIFNGLKYVILQALKKMLDSAQFFLGWIPGIKGKIAKAKEAIDGMIEETKQKQQTLTIEHENNKRVLSYQKTAQEIKKSLHEIGKASDEELRRRDVNLQKEKFLRNQMVKNVQETTQQAVQAVYSGVENTKAASKSLFDTVSDHLNKISEKTQNAVDIIEKKLELWSLKNNVAKESSEYLSKQLEVQQEKHQLLTQEIQATEEALAKIVAKYGESSNEALEYRNKLLDLQIAQANLAEEIKKTTEEMEKQRQTQIELYDDGSARIGNITYSRSYLERARKNREKKYEENMDEIRAIAERNNVDLSVAKDMFDANERAKLRGEVPRYHNGGTVIDWISKAFGGLRRNEVPIIAEVGEYIIPKNMVNKIQNNKPVVNINIYGGDKDRIYQTVRHAIGGNIV